MTCGAKCWCGTCSIEVHGERDINAICHCSNCKRRTSSAFGWSAYFLDGRITRRHGAFRVCEIGGVDPQRR